ncbi:hypothetical protein CASFOL_020694 [Castilleja foliolosa]|uniref:Uncharacterized protein n=1 Tax=Castilleja foliolosa TaxID=1961234 RepID=A0ABD3D2D7_9LAMI
MEMQQIVARWVNMLTVIHQAVLLLILVKGNLEVRTLMIVAVLHVQILHSIERFKRRGLLGEMLYLILLDRDELLVHISLPLRWTCKICSLAANITSSTLRPCEFRMGKVLDSLQTFRCTYTVLM